MGNKKNTGLGKALIRQRFNGKKNGKDSEYFKVIYPTKLFFFFLYYILILK